MAFDICGRRPTSERGDHFQASGACWDSLWNYCLRVAPVASTVEHWNGNNGFGLDGSQARRLADALRGELSSGGTAHYVRSGMAFFGASSADDCKEYTFSSISTFDSAESFRVPCYSRGTPCNEWCFSEEVVRTFVEFLDHSDGFNIW